MTTLVTYKFGAPFKGVSRQFDPYVAATQGYLSKAHNVNYDYAGAISPMPKLMKEVAQLNTPAYFMFYHYGAGWIYDDIRLTSGAYNWGLTAARTKANYTVSYKTTIASNGSVGAPLKYRGTESFPMGLIAPTAAATAGAAGAGGNISVVYTYLAISATESDVESNPSPLYPTPNSGVTLKGGTTITVTWPSWTGNARVTHANIYATEEGSPDGTLYYAGYVTRSAGSTFVVTSARDLTKPMNWGPGGTPENDYDVYFDHSPPGNVTCLSNRLHGSEAGASDNDGGILFYAIDNQVGWTQSGQHEYFPKANLYKLAGTVQALVTSGTQTFAFLPDQVWAFSGQHSTAISARQLATRRGVQVGKAKTVQATPYGIIYVSQEGLTLFDGNDARLICRETLREFNDQDHWVGVYVDGYYYLCKPESGGVDTWKIDLQNPENPIITTTDIGFWASFTLEQGSWLSPTGEAVLNQGINWNAATTYAKNQSFGEDIRQYVSLQNGNLNREAELRQDWWALIPNGQTFVLSSGFNIVTSPPPAWSATMAYSAGDVVSYNGSNFYANKATTGVTPTGAFGNDWTPHFNNNGYRQGVCPYTEDPNTNDSAPLQVDVLSNPLRLGKLNSVLGLRRFRVDGNLGNATITFWCDVPSGWTSGINGPEVYSKTVLVDNMYPQRYMLPMSLRGESFQFRIQSSQAGSFQFRQLEIEGSVNR